MTLFELLSQEEVDRITLWVSPTPSEKHWASNVNLRELNSCLSLSPMFRAPIQLLLDEKKIPDVNSRFAPEVEDPFSTPLVAPLVKSVDLTNSIIPVEALSLFSNLRCLALDFCPEIQEGRISNLGNYLKNTNLTSLAFSMFSRNIPPSILAHCSNLRFLQIPEPFMDITTWRAVGTRLETLYITRVPSSAATVMLLIRDNCRLLQDISMGTVSANVPVYIDALLLYGVQLRRAHVGNLTLQQARRLVEHCPNLRLKASFYPYPDLAAVEVLGDRIDELHLERGLSQRWSSQYLRLLSTRVSQAQLMELHHPMQHHSVLAKPRLQKIKITRGTLQPRSFFSALASNTGSLTCVELCISFIPPARAFEKLIAANPKLEAFELNLERHLMGNRLNRPPEATEFQRINLLDVSALSTYFTSILKAMHKLKFIEIVRMNVINMENGDDLDFGKEKRIADACVPFRHRPVHVSVNSYMFLPVESVFHW